MATLHKSDERLPSLADAAFTQELERVKAAHASMKARKRKERAGYSRVEMGESWLGDRTHNCPPLRKWAKVKNRLELSQHTFLTTPNGRCVILDEHGYVDNVMTMAVLTHYRYITASRKEVWHYAE